MGSFSVSEECIFQTWNLVTVILEFIGVAPADLVRPAAALEPHLETFLLLDCIQSKAGAYRRSYTFLDILQALESKSVRISVNSGNFCI